MDLRLRYIDGQGVIAPTLEVRAMPVEDRVGFFRLPLEPPAGATGVQYQIVAPNGRHFSGLGSKHWVEDDSGSFWADYQLDEPARIEFTLSDLPPSGLEAEFGLRGERVVLSREAEAEDLVEDLRHVPWGVGENWGCTVGLAAASHTRADISILEDPVLRAFAALAWGRILGREGCLDEAELQWVLDTVPPEHVVWAFQGIRIHDLFADRIDAPLVRLTRIQLAAAQTEPGLLAHLLYLNILDAERSEDPSLVRETYATLIQDYPTSYSAQLAKETFDPERPLQVGRAMPAWSFLGLDGEPVGTADFAGRPYLLEVWATWCGPCTDEMESVHAAWETLGAAEGPVSFVWVSIDTELEPIHAFRRERWPMPWIHAQEPDAQDLFDAWWFGGIPLLVLVDGGGQIVATSATLRGDALLPSLQNIGVPSL